MRTEVYTFLGLATLCTAVEYWGVTANVFDYGEALVVGMCFTVCAFFSLYNAVRAVK